MHACIPKNLFIDEKNFNYQYSQSKHHDISQNKQITGRIY